nr:serpin family protein [Leucobacter weissii]
MRTVGLDDAGALDAVVAATGALGLTVLGAAPDEGNAVVSPASLATALAMLGEGARGESLDELERALGASGEERRDAFAALQRSVLELDGDPFDATADELPERPILHLANNVVVHNGEGFEVLPEYLAALADGFDAGVQYADLTSDAGKAVLSEWVNEHTGGLIEESAIRTHADLRVVLQDAILFAARWQTPFDAGSSYRRPFTLPSGERVEVDTMHASGGEGGVFAHAELGGGWVAVRLPYQEGAHSDLLLPPKGTDPAAATPALLAEAAEQLDAAKPVPLALSLPKIDIEAETPLDLIESGALEQAGVSAVVCGSGRSDLSGIAGGSTRLCLDQAVQQAVLRVDEAGTVAAAATEVGISTFSAQAAPAAVHFDRPFLLTITHSESGWPLFQAAIRDPR